MEHYAGLDVSLHMTAVCVIDERGRVVIEGKVPSEPDAIAAFLQPYADTLALAGLEAGLLAPYLYSGLVARGVRAVCIETRHMKAFAKASPVKTDRKDAHLIALAMKAGLYRAVHVKTDESQRLRFLLTARELLMRQVRQLEGTLRGSFKAFGLRMGNIAKRQFADRAKELAQGQGLLAEVMRPLLAARKAMLEQLARLDRMVLLAARRDPVCRRLMTAPGVGTVVALAFRTTIDISQRFSQSAMVAPHLGLTPRKYQSGQTDRSGRISKYGDAMMRHLLYESATLVLGRLKRPAAVKQWGLQIAERRGLKRARVAVARKLAVILHRMWLDGTNFRWDDAAASAV
jgi:transposase